MHRREFVKITGALTTGAMLSHAPAVHAKEQYKWTMVTSFPKNLGGVGTSGVYLAKIIERMAGGRIAISVYGAGELVPAFEAFDAVAAGKAQIGYGTPYYWKDKHPAFSFFSVIPFGLNAHEMISWLQFGGGQELMDELYAGYNLKPFPAGNTGTQMGGWFNKEITSINDFKNLKIRMPGLGGEILTRAGAHVVNIPSDEVYEALASGTVDAAEWVAPFDDMTLELYKAARYYYWPGWHEPGTVVDCFVNKTEYNSLPADLQEIIRQASLATYSYTWAEYSANNGASLKELLQTHHVQLRRFPESVLADLAKMSREVIAETVAQYPFLQRVYHSYDAFRDEAVGWAQVGEEAYSLARTRIYSYLE